MDGENNMTTAVANMPINNIWMFENGTIATKQIGYFDEQTDAWFIRTDDK